VAGPGALRQERDELLQRALGLADDTEPEDLLELLATENATGE